MSFNLSFFRGEVINRINNLEKELKTLKYLMEYGTKLTDKKCSGCKSTNNLEKIQAIYKEYYMCKKCLKKRGYKNGKDE